MQNAAIAGKKTLHGAANESLESAENGAVRGQVGGNETPDSGAASPNALRASLGLDGFGGVGARIAERSHAGNAYQLGEAWWAAERRDHEPPVEGMSRVVVKFADGELWVTQVNGAPEEALARYLRRKYVVRELMKGRHCAFYVEGSENG